MWCYQIVIYVLVQSLCRIVCVCVCVFIYIYLKNPSIVLWLLCCECSTLFVFIMFGKTSVVYVFRNTWNACFYSLIFHIRWATSKTLQLLNHHYLIGQLCCTMSLNKHAHAMFLNIYILAQYSQKEKFKNHKLKKQSVFFFFLSLRVLIIAWSEEEK
jgi:hypothetical protein